MVVETVTTFGADDLAFVRIRCKRCLSATEISPKCAGSVEEFRRRVTSRGGIRCSNCDGGTAPILLRLESEFKNDAHGPVNGVLALLVLTMLRAAREPEPKHGDQGEHAQVQFAVGQTVRGIPEVG